MKTIFRHHIMCLAVRAPFASGCPKMRQLVFARALFYLLALGLTASGILASPAAVAFDPQRHIIFHNELPFPIYPVITAVESENYRCGTGRGGL